MSLIVYAGFLSMMGVFIASGLTLAARTTASSRRTRRSSRRDRSRRKRCPDGLAAHLREQGIEVPIEDSQMALQDAVAKGQELVHPHVPEGFGDAFVEAARTGDELPTLENAVYSFYSTEGSLDGPDGEIRTWASRARTPASKDRLRRAISCYAAEAMAESAETDSVEVGGTSSGRSGSCSSSNGHQTVRLHHRVVGVYDHAQPHSLRRRRNLVSPLPSLSIGCVWQRAAFPAGHDGGVAVDDLFGIHHIQ